MSWVRSIALVIVAGVVTAVAGCSSPPSFKYKLTLSVETPEGVKSASNVVLIHHGQVMITASGGIMTHARGEALYLDLGPGRRPLIALLTKSVEARRARQGRRDDWGEVSPFNVLAKAYGERFTDYGDRGQHLETIARHRGAKEITPAVLPDLVTFADVSDPKSVMAVDPDDLAATLGSGVKWHKITIEVTDEPLTTGIEKKLGWLRGYEGSLAHPGRGGVVTSNDLADNLGLWNFKQGGR